jgi:hypothetical protein
VVCNLCSSWLLSLDLCSLLVVGKFIP